MGARIAEIGQNPVAHELGHEAVIAGDHASAHSEADRYVEAGLTLMSRLSEGPDRQALDLALGLARANALTQLKGYTASETIAALAATKRLLDAGAGSDLQRFSVLFGLCAADFFAARTEPALDLARQMVEVADRQDDSLYRLVAYRLLGTTQVTNAHYREGEGWPLEYNRHRAVVGSSGSPGWLALRQPRRSHHPHALGQRVRYRCQRGLATCCRIFADMGRKWRGRSSCRSNSELAVFILAHKKLGRQQSGTQRQRRNGREATVRVERRCTVDGLVPTRQMSS